MWFYYFKKSLFLKNAPLLYSRYKYAGLRCLSIYFYFKKNS